MTPTPTPAAGPELVVIGASAGGVDALSVVFRELPEDFPAAVMVVLHLAPSSPSLLPHILGRVSAIRVQTAIDGHRIEPGTAYIARPDLHLTVDDGHMRLLPSARVNGHRPAIDPLFCSAAEAYGPRLAAVILSGTRDDGTIGMARVKTLGGHCIVQDPEDALHDSMPRSAMEHVQVDAVLPAHEIADALDHLVRAGGIGGNTVPASVLPPPVLPGSLTTVCPECGGVLTEHLVERVPTFSCHAGHRYAPHTLAELQGTSVENALWAAVRTLSDRQALLDRLADQAEVRGQHRAASIWRGQARASAAQADSVRHVIAALAVGSALHEPEPAVIEEFQQ